jgi:hypothetical protein
LSCGYVVRGARRTTAACHSATGEGWKKHPVIYLYLNQGIYNSWEGYLCALRNNLELLETRYGIVFPEKDREANEELSFPVRLGCIIRSAAQQSDEKVVVLIDEYDKPLTDRRNDPDLHQRFRSVLRAFYGVFKSADQYLRFVFMTGITRFYHFFLLCYHHARFPLGTNSGSSLEPTSVLAWNRLQFQLRIDPNS